jgi:arylsulfatase A
MKNWIASIVVALAGLGSGQAAGEPNIVLIMADDMGYECVTANGGESHSTPNLDRLARGGCGSSTATRSRSARRRGCS